jgi:hypothetical protein
MSVARKKKPDFAGNSLFPMKFGLFVSCSNGVESGRGNLVDRGAKVFTTVSARYWSDRSCVCPGLSWRKPQSTCSARLPGGRHAPSEHHDEPGRQPQPIQTLHAQVRFS